MNQQNQTKALNKTTMYEATTNDGNQVLLYTSTHKSIDDKADSEDSDSEDYTPLATDAERQDDYEEDEYVNELLYGNPWPEADPKPKYMVDFGDAVKAQTDGLGNWWTRDGDRIYPTFLSTGNNQYCDVTGNVHSNNGLRLKAPYLFNDVEQAEFEYIKCKHVSEL